MDAATVKRLLELVPHPEEGGSFRETYRSLRRLEDDPQGHSLSTAIYYLLEPGTVSELHALTADEVFHFYLGDPVEQLHLHPDGRSELVVLGTDLAAGQRPQVVVPAGVWQGASLATGGRFALLGCTVSPGFEYRDYRTADRDALLPAFPRHAERIRLLTPRQG